MENHLELQQGEWMGVGLLKRWPRDGACFCILIIWSKWCGVETLGICYCFHPNFATSTVGETEFWMLNTFILQGVIATKITQQNTCYISIMNRTDIPSFNSLARLAAESRVRIQRSSMFLTLEFISSFPLLLLLPGEDQVMSSGRISLQSTVM